MKTVAIALLGGALLLAAPAAAAPLLSYGEAKRAISEEATWACRHSEGCESWTGSECVRRSPGRIDCRLDFYFTEEADCRYEVIVKKSSPDATVRLRHERVSC